MSDDGEPDSHMPQVGAHRLPDPVSLEDCTDSVATSQDESVSSEAFYDSHPLISLTKVPSQDSNAEEIHPAERPAARLQDLGDNYYTENDLDLLADLVADERKRMKVLSKRLSRERLKLRPSREILASGAHGHVLQAINLRTGELLVIKEVCLRDKEGHAQEIEREIHTMKLLNHRNVVGYRGVQKHDDKIWIVMEHCPGGSLATVLGKFGPLETSVVRRYCKQICEGLSYLHRHGFVHCDVKCANCLLGNEGVVKLADFGASRRLVKMGANLNASGTLSHMAPEVVQHERIGRQADVWSLGCSVMFMLTMTLPGDAPTTAHSETATLWRWLSTLETSPPPPSGIPDDAQDFIAQCLVFEPEKRPSILRILQHRFLLPVVMLPVSPVHRTHSNVSTSSFDSASALGRSSSTEWHAHNLNADAASTASMSMSMSISVSQASPRSSDGSEQRLSPVYHRRPARRASSSSVSSRDSPLAALPSSRRRRHRARKRFDIVPDEMAVGGLWWWVWDLSFPEPTEKQFVTFQRMKGFQSWQRVVPELLLCSLILVLPTIVLLITNFPDPPADQDFRPLDDAFQVIGLVCHCLSVAVSIQPHEADWVSSSGLLMWYARLSLAQFVVFTIADASPLMPTVFLYLISFNLRLACSHREVAAGQALFLASRSYHAASAIYGHIRASSRADEKQAVAAGSSALLLLVQIAPLGLQGALCTVHFLHNIRRLAGWRQEFLVISGKAREDDTPRTRGSSISSLHGTSSSASGSFLLQRSISR